VKRAKTPTAIAVGWFDQQEYSLIKTLLMIVKIEKNKYKGVGFIAVFFIISLVDLFV
jgi:hypothetical protein